MKTLLDFLRLGWRLIAFGPWPLRFSPEVFYVAPEVKTHAESTDAEHFSGRHLN